MSYPIQANHPSTFDTSNGFSQHIQRLVTYLHSNQHHNRDFLVSLLKLKQMNKTKDVMNIHMVEPHYTGL